MWTKKKKIIYIFYIALAKWLPESRHFSLAKKIRCFFAKRIMKDMGINVNIEKGAIFGPDIVIGNESGIGINCELSGPVVIGDEVMMGPEVVVYTQNHKHNLGTPFGKQGYDIKPVEIGNNVWIGRRAMFMPGSKIDNNVVVTAEAIISGEFPSNVIIGGVPAKIIKEIS